MGDVYGIGKSGLQAFQRALATTSHNISNVATEGYSRQVVDFATRPPIQIGNIFEGSGVNISSLHRVIDEFANNQILVFTSNSNMYEAFHTLSSQIDEMLANESIGIDSSIQSFFDAINTVASDPTALPARQSMFSEAESLIDRFHFLNQNVTDINLAINKQLGTITQEINDLAQVFSDLNNEIVASGGNSIDFPANDLLDQRDLLLRKISEKVSVSTVEQTDGSMNVFVGSGQPLVIGTRAFDLVTQISTTKPGEVDIAYDNGSSQVIVTDFIEGGEIGGVLDFRDNVAYPVLDELDRLAAGFALSFNSQHRMGMDLDGDINNNFFTDLTNAGLVRPGDANTGSAAITTTITNVSELKAADYSLSFNAGNFTVTDQTDNSVVATIAAGAVGSTYAVPGHGFSFTVNVSNPNNGDTFFVDPDNNAAKNLGLNITTLNDISAAAPIRTIEDLNNLGGASITQGTVTDSTNSDLLNTVTITFDAANTEYDIVDAVNGVLPSVAYVAGTPTQFSINGWQAEISGVPQDGDIFTVQSNAGGVGDNRNALLLIDLQNTQILDNQTGTYQEVYGNLVADVGIQTRQAEINSDAQSVLLQNAVQRRESVSGVNLDEEAANLLKFQQAYQAAAQVISTANDMFQSLINVFR
jgi:flagellar hook-associated protein 1 FlgK